MAKGIHGSYERQGSILKRADGVRLLIQNRPVSKQTPSKPPQYLLRLPNEGDVIKDRQYLSSLYETGIPHNYELEWDGVRFVLHLKGSRAHIHVKDSAIKVKSS